MNLKRFPHDISERAARATKKPKSCSQDHSFIPIINPRTVLEISAVPDYFCTTFIRLLRKIKNGDFWWALSLFDDHENHYFLFSQKADKSYTEILRNCCCFQNCHWIIIRIKTEVMRAKIRLFEPVNLENPSSNFDHQYLRNRLIDFNIFFGIRTEIYLAFT